MTKTLNLKNMIIIATYGVLNHLALEFKTETALEGGDMSLCGLKLVWISK